MKCYRRGNRVLGSPKNFIFFGVTCKNQPRNPTLFEFSWKKIVELALPLGPTLIKIWRSWVRFLSVFFLKLKKKIHRHPSLWVHLIFYSNALIKLVELKDMTSPAQGSFILEQKQKRRFWWVHKESNLMFALNSDKSQRNNLLSLNIIEPLYLW